MANDAPLTVRFEGERTGVDGSGRRRRLLASTNLKSWSIESDYLGSCDGFEFEIFDENPENLRDLECQPVQLVLAGASQLLGRIDATVRGGDGLSVNCRGRDYRADLVECNVDPTLTVKEGERLGEMIVRACAPVGITHVADGSDTATIRNVRTGVVVGVRGAHKSFQDLKLEDFKPDPGKGLFEFLKPICSRHGCSIQAGPRRSTLLISSPVYSQDVAYKIVRSRTGTGSNNNVISATAARDYSSFPTLVVVQGLGAPRAGEATSSTQANVDTWSVAQHIEGELARTLNSITWSGRRKPGDHSPLGLEKIYRLNVFRDETARNPAQIAKASRRLLAEHLKNTLQYTATLRGHVDPSTGAIWSIDTLVDVSDDICDVHEKLWIVKRTLRYAPGAGATTDIVALRPGSYEPDGEATNLSIATFNSINSGGAF